MLKTIPQTFEYPDGMQGTIKMHVFPFPPEVASRGCDIFPLELEEDETVFFHATPAENLEKIFIEGLRPDPQNTSGLKSVTYTYRSNVALIHITNRNKYKPKDHCILVYKFDDYAMKRLIKNTTDVHDYAINPRPTLIGYCIVPYTYQHQ